MCLPGLLCYPHVNPLMFSVLTIYRYLPLLLLTVTFFLLGFLLLGAASTDSAYSLVYLIKLSYTSGAATNGTLADLVIKANYLAMCATASSETVCTTNTNITGLGGLGDSSLVTILTMLAKVCRPYLVETTIVLVVVLLACELYTAIPFVPGKLLARRLCAGFGAVSCLVWGLGAMLQHQGVAGAQAFVQAANNTILVLKGTRAEAMLWTAFAMLVVTFLALLVRVILDNRIVKEPTKC